MSIDTTGQWWKGTEAADLREYLVAYAEDGYAVNEFRLAKCVCESEIFELEADDDEGAAKRTCSSCLKEHFICDSAEYWTEAEPEEFVCIECGSNLVNIGVGFSLYEEGDVRWLYVGTRCVSCGVLGCFAEWKVGYGPSHHLIERA